MEGRDLALDAPQAGVELVLGEVLQHVVAEDVACDEFRGVRVHRDAGVVREFLLLVELLEGHVLRRDGGDHARGHHVIGLDVVQLHDVLDDLVLGIVNDAFFLAHVRHCGHFLAGDAGVRLVTGDAHPEFFHEPDDGIQDDHQAFHDAGQPDEAFPVVGADGLRDDLGEDEDQDRHDGGDQAEPLAAEQFGGLLAHAGGAHGVRDRVQRENGRQGTVRIVLELGEEDGVPVTFFLFHREVGDGGGQKGGLQQ